MAEIHHLGHGWVTPTMSYLLSVLGSLLGLTCAVRFRSAQSSSGRTFWLVLAAVAIGGTGIWTMHFVAMLGFDVVGTPIRYDVGLTAASALLAVVAVGIGLAIALNGARAQQLRIVIGGVLAGLGVAAMHYTGMAAMELDGTIDYSTTRVGMSVGIAVVAAAVALWLAVTVRKPLAILAAAMIMGVAVNGMHFTGMSAMSVRLEQPAGPLSGATATQLLLPIGLAVVFGVLGLVYSLMAAPTEEDRAALEYLAARREATAAPAAPATEAPRPVFGGAPQGPAAPPPPLPPQRRPNTGPTLGERLSSLQQEEVQGGEPGPNTGPQIPAQRRRMPTSDSSWTARDRAEK